ncbi:alpha-glucan water dikinase, chloroplastic-like [Papaver somniferum]|uniref:alpha-glucan water dikinase, chloroplastic-like n=1 Tax=Papaver somniferum TaxID=3469 RepID=UPI000E700B00|nr:alpha-glucan water dikinase, chloroplastic-like [Papaver somniferum]
MSNTLGNSLLHQSLYRFAVLEHQSKTSCANSLFQASSAIHKKTFLSTSFRGNCLNVKKKSKIPKGGRNMNYVVPHAVLATNPASELAGRYNLDGISELQIDVTAPTSGSLMQVVIQVSNSSNSLVLHWGGIRDGQKNWVLPSCQPDGSKLYKNRAIRTPFVKSGSSSTVTIEIDDPQIQAIEFLIIEESQNKWFKCNGDNFHVQLAQRAKRSSNSSVPEDLVQIQAYLRWERKGKQMYTPEQEKEEYEAARTELQDELERGLSVEELRSKITKSDGKSKTKEASAPDEKSKTPKKQETNRHYNVEKIQRKRRDFMELLNKYAAESVKENVNNTPKPPTAVELFTKAKEEQYGDSVINKRTFKLGDKKVVALVTKTLGKTKVYLATDFVEPLTLHWALSKNAGEWQAPPTSLLPEGSTLLDQASETQFKKSSSSDPTYQVQSLEIEIGEEDYVGMPFVLLSGGNWMKDSGSDFYVDFKTGPKKVKQNPGGGKGTAKALLDKIADMESEAQKSFMHRFNIAADLVDWAKDAGELGLAGILVWMRFMATRQLTWNKNYNVKPREISKAQDRLTDLLQNVCKSQPQNREILRMIMSTVGRGGEGDVGQRIRDEILVVQRNNNCSGGMMEEWHQKLHNNTSPDDVIICQALIDYIKSDFDISVYWNTLNSNGITKERLLSYDRGIHSEPHFSSDQKNCLLHDLGNYMRTLKAVHSGADLESAIANCMGYKAEGQGFMVGVNINPIVGLPSGFPDLLSFVLNHVEDKNVEPLLESLLEAREELRPSLLNTHDRLRDLLFLDIALDSTVRTVIERGYEELKNAGPEKIMYFISLVLENLALSSDNNEDLIYCLKGWDHAMNLAKGGDSNWALYAKSILDRTRLALTTKAEHYQKILQPSAEYLGSLLGVDKWALSIFTEEMIRAGSAASLSALLNRLDPVLRKTANLGSWQVISPVEVTGYVEVVNELLAVQNKTYERPTILVAKNVRGEEEIPDGTVAVLTPDMPDVLSHVSVRARNSKVCFATCFDPDILSDLQSKEGKLLCLKPTSADVVYSEVKDSELSGASTNSTEDGSLPSISLVKKQFAGRYAISSEEFTSEMVGAKSRNISYIKGKVPSWVGIPTSIALPFGVFEEVLSEGLNKEVAEKLQSLKKRLGNGETETLGEIRKTVLGLAAPPQLVQELKNKMQSSDMPWPGDEGEKRWDQAWMAIKKVWASKWNERAYYSTRKVKLDHDFLCMSVLVQEVINADYAFVIHTTNPSSGDSSEIYTEVVKGLGETLVGAYPGRALSFVCKKDDLDSPKLLGYPSKPIGLFIRRSLIFRSDSNGEDLEGYAGAGLYDSVPMDEEEKVVVDYSTDPLIMDSNFRNKILSSIARAGHAIEELYGSAQDIEGVVKDGKIYVVQTRPQM